MLESSPVSESATPNARAHRRRALRQALGRLEPSLRIVAEDVLALQSRIDWVAVDDQQRIVAILLVNHNEDAAGVPGALAHRQWLLEHLPDWLQLAPDLGAHPTAGARAILVAPSFLPETIAAVGALPADWLQLLRTNEPGPRATATAADTGTDFSGSTAPVLQDHQVTFRSGLSSQDLKMTDEEAKEFE